MDEQTLLKSNGKLSFSNFFSWVFDLTWWKKKWWKIIVALLVIAALWLVIWFLTSWISKLILRAWSRPLFYIWSLLFYFWDLLLTSAFTIWMMNLLFNIVKKWDGVVDDLFKNIWWKKIWRIAWCTLIFWLVWFVFWLLFSVIIPNASPILMFIILIIPLLILCTRFMFPYYAVVDKWLWSIDALSYSWNITKWRFWEIFWLLLCFVWFTLIFWLLCLLFSHVILLLILLVIAFYILFIPLFAIALAKYYFIISEKYENKSGGSSIWGQSNPWNVPNFENMPNMWNLTNVGSIPNIGNEINMGNYPDTNIGSWTNVQMQ